MRNNKTFIMVMCAMAIAINIVLGFVVQRMQIPQLYLDTIGTIFIAVLFGPWAGASVGTLTNVLTPLLTGNPKDIPFFLVNMAVGIIVGYIAKKFKFDWKTAMVSGLILSVVCPLVGTVIAVWVYGGITGSGNDFIVVWLKNSGMSIFSAAFIPRITGNFIDKIGSCLLVMEVIRRLPARYKNYNVEAETETQENATV